MKRIITILLSSLPTFLFAQTNVFPPSGNTGIGTVNPLSTLHVYDGASGKAPHGFSDLSVETNDHVMLSLLTLNTKTAYYAFADTDDDFVGGIQYNHPNDIMYFRVNNHDSDMVINKDGNVGIGTTTPSDILHVSSGDSGDAVLHLEADTDNNNEYDNPMIKLRQDGGAVGINIGYSQENFGENIFGIGTKFNSGESWNNFT